MSAEILKTDSSIRHGYAQVGDVRLHYAEHGEGERLVILLHGFPEFWYSWRHQLTALGDGFHVVAPDLRGYNLSDKPARVEDYRMSALVDDVIGLTHHFGKNEAIIVGHDWGAAIAWATARDFPQYVTKLVALQVPPPAAFRANMTIKQALSSWYMLFFQLPRVPEWLITARDFASIERSFKQNAAPGAFSDADIEAYKNALRQTGETTALTAAINYYRANFAPMFLRRSEGVKHDPRVRVPSLFIYGEKDFAILPSTVRGVKKYVDAPYGELRLANSNHWVQNEAPAEVNAALVSFLNS